MSSPRQTFSLDLGWRFHLGDVAAPLSNRHIAAYMANKAGWARGAAKPSFDDSDWRPVSLPHDWSIDGEFSKDNHINAGYLPRGVGWYRRHFALDESQRDRCIQLRFDGISSHATIYVNGHLLHRHFCGYTPMMIDITDIATFGETLNVIAVRVDATSPEGWWYEGAGIYRHAWLTLTAPLHVEEFGVFVNPRLVDGTADRWEALIETTAINHTSIPLDYRIESIVEDPSGTRVGQTISQASVASRKSHVANQMISIDQPRRWSLEHRNLYSLRTRLFDGDQILDEVLTTFGFRTIRFDADRGFFLNDQPTKLKGTCNHQDHAGVGVALPDSLHEFRIRRLLEMGSNAYRSAHHPPASELLEACDRLGMLVMDENRNYGSSPEHIEQLRTMIRRDRNHPCVILWALCNEEAIQATRTGEMIARTLAAETRVLDSSRAVTAAVSGGVLNEHDCIPNALDVMGINYQIGTYDAFHQLRPTMPLIAAETHCVLSTRGRYETGGNYFDTFGEQKAPWGETAQRTWAAVRDRPFVAGLFAWTGFDYRGEPTPLEWPSVTSHWGMLDLCGFEKDAFYLHKAFWSDEPFVHITTDWARGGDGRAVVYSNCDQIELLDGRRLTVDPINMAECLQSDLPNPVVGFRNGKPVANCLCHVGKNVTQLKLQIHPTLADMLNGDVAPADGMFTLPITVSAVDDEGRFVSTADSLVSFHVRGNATLIGLGNGDPVSHEADHGNTRKLFNGLAQALIQTTRRSGLIELTAHAEGLLPATLELRSKEVQDVQSKLVSVPIVRRFIHDWRMSPISKDPPVDLSGEVGSQDMNSWERIDPSKPSEKTAHGFAIYRSQFTLPRSMQLHGGRIQFRRLDASCRVALNGRAVEVSCLTIEIPSDSPGPSTLVIVDQIDGGPSKFLGPVELIENSDV